MEYIKKFFRFILVLLVSYLISAFVALIFVHVFNFHDDFLLGVISGGIIVGLMMSYYQKRKIKSLLLRYDNDYEEYMKLKKKFG